MCLTVRAIRRIGSMMLLGVLPFLIATVSHARELAPGFYYLSAIKCNNAVIKADSVESAFAQYKSGYGACNPTMRVKGFRVSEANQYFYNGKAASYSVDVEFLPSDNGEPDTGDNQELVTIPGQIVAVPECPEGFAYPVPVPGQPNHYRVTCSSTLSEPEQPEPDLCHGPKAGNPILPSTGVKEQTETDYHGSGSNSLRFTRTYRSDRNGWVHNYQSTGIDYTAPAPDDSGNACHRGILPTTGTAYCYPYMPTGMDHDFAVHRGSNRMLNFGTATDLSPARDVNDRVTPLFDGNGAKIGFQVYNAANDTTERYDLNGRLQSITKLNGQVQTFTYSDTATPGEIAPKAGLLIRVTDHFGRKIEFTYDSAGRMHTMTDPGGGQYLYAYDEPSSIVLPGNNPVNNLTSVTYPDQKKRIYWYNEQANTSDANLPFALTGISDENGVRFATFKYDSAGKAISTEHAGGVAKYTVAYDDLYSQSTVTDPLNSARTYRFQTILGVVKSTGQSQPGGSGCNAASNTIAHDANGNIAARTDFNGVNTTYTYDLKRNLEIRRVEAAGTPQARTITTEWHPVHRLPARIAEPHRLTSNTYDEQGNLLARTVQATSDASGTQGMDAPLSGPARTWRWTYNRFGQVLTATGPRTDVTQVSKYSYDEQGNLATLTNAIGQVTTLADYDAHGRPGKIVEPNGLVTTLTYHPRGWLTARNVEGEITTYDYDNAGQLIQVTQPDGATLSYSYDDAHRLTAIADSLGNRIRYTLDAMGNRLQEAVRDPGGALARQTIRVYDALNRLHQLTGAQP